MYGTDSILKIRQVLIASNWGQITYMKLVEVTPVLKQKSMVSLTLEVIQLKNSIITDPISLQGTIYRIYHNMITCRWTNSVTQTLLLAINSSATCLTRRIFLFTVSHQFLSNLPDEENISFGIFLGDQCYSGNEIALIDMQKVYDLALEKLKHKKRGKVP